MNAPIPITLPVTAEIPIDLLKKLQRLQPGCDAEEAVERALTLACMLTDHIREDDHGRYIEYVDRTGDRRRIDLED